MMHKGIESHRLDPGVVWIIEKDTKHFFETKDESLTIVAFHPDSDWGPTDEIHPMLNRTII
jgi:quercetin dioxygenase-like cupin family protein